MFFESITGQVTEFTSDAQTRFQCTVRLSVPIDMLPQIEFGTLIAAENTFHTQKEKHYTILTVLTPFPDTAQGKTQKQKQYSLLCKACPIGMELVVKGAKDEPSFPFSDTWPVLDAGAFVLDDNTTALILHQLAPDSHAKINGSRIDIGSYATNPKVKVGIDTTFLLRGNSAILSSRSRARTTIVTGLIAALLRNTSNPVHIVYCDVNNQTTLSLTNLLAALDNTSVLCLNDKFVPPSVFAALKNQGDRQALKRAAYDYLDMMILPSVLEHRRQEFSFAIHGLLRSNKISIYRPNEQTVDQFINDIRIDILDGIDEEIESFVSGLMDGIAETFRGERFGEKNTKDILDMIDEFGMDSKNHNARRTLYDLRAEVQAVYETYSKDIPSTSRKTVPDIVNELNDDSKSSLIIMQGQKTTDILRFIGTLTQTLIDERLKRLKIRVPVLFIFNNADDYFARPGFGREGSSERFQDIISSILTSGRRHGMSFCLTMENGSLIEKSLSRKIQSYFIGPIGFGEDATTVARLLNVSEDLIQPAVNFDDGVFMLSSSDSPYHRRVPLPMRTRKNTDTMHAFLDVLSEEQERRRKEFMAMEDDRPRHGQDERKPQKPEIPVRQAPERRPVPDQARSHPEQQQTERQSKPQDLRRPVHIAHATPKEVTAPSTPEHAQTPEKSASSERSPLRFEFTPASIVQARAAQAIQEKKVDGEVEAPARSAQAETVAEAPAAAAVPVQSKSRHRRGGRAQHPAPAKADLPVAADSASAKPSENPPPQAKPAGKSQAQLPIEQLTFEPRRETGDAKPKDEKPAPDTAAAEPGQDNVKAPKKAAKGKVKKPVPAKPAKSTKRKAAAKKDEGSGADSE
jgi:hypothetical protein